MNLICVAPNLVDQFWPYVQSLVEMAFWAGRGDDSAEALYKDLKADKALLWIVWDDCQKEIACAAITKLFLFNRGKTCIIAACAARSQSNVFADLNRMDRWSQLMTTVEKYAKDEGCKYIRLSGRRGWVYYYRNQGWYEPWITLEKEL